MYEALRQNGHKVHALGPARPGPLRLILAALNQIGLKLFRKRFDYRHSKLYAKAFGRIFTKKLQGLQYDLVVVCGGTEYGAYLQTQKPVVYVLDRTIGGALNYHNILSDLWSFSKSQSVFTDKKAMQEASMLFFSSQWAAHHAQKLYAVPESKTVVLPFGANLDSLPERNIALKKKQTGSWKLLLIGTYWLNKGADIAYNALLHLLKNGIDASLTVVGCTPPVKQEHERLRIIPFVDKNSPEGLKQLWDLYLEHHFFILPTRFDCTPIVFCEAAAFGLPVLSADTGGVGGHVKSGTNGYLIPYEDKGAGYAEKITTIIHTPGHYDALCTSSRNHFEKELNWTAWANGFNEHLARIASH